MLKLEKISKVYSTGYKKVQALQDISVEFRKSEFVCILGPSGCGKTTLLNLIGGLDRYTTGDMQIDRVSTRKYKPRDWDSYRNHTVGFVFQNYHLIPHQSVLSNVEMALILSGMKKNEAQKRAAKVLTALGLGNQLEKKPAELSGGQMQRVAIARALVNSPGILLADEPTGALDSETSIQIMDILAEVAKKRLVIMVTHNPELAQKYATRIIRILDGKIVSDTRPVTEEERNKAKKTRDFSARGKTSMSFFAALGLSFSNLLTKKGRSLLTAFAGSIGIIGIALILSLSNGARNFISQVQQNTLSGYPLVIEQDTSGLSGVVNNLMTQTENAQGDYSEAPSIVYNFASSIKEASSGKVDLSGLKKFVETDKELQTHISAVAYDYGLNLDIYAKDPNGEIVFSDILSMLKTDYQNLLETRYGKIFFDLLNTQTWKELLPGENGELIHDIILDQYDVVYGRWPEASDEVMLFVGKDNTISDTLLYSIGLKSRAELSGVLTASFHRESLETKDETYTYKDLCNQTLKLFFADEYWIKQDSSGKYRDLRENAAGLDYLYNNEGVGKKLKIVGVAKPNEKNVTSIISSGSIGYLSLLTQEVVERTNQSEIVQAQLSNPYKDVFTGTPFAGDDSDNISDSEKKTLLREYAAGLSAQEKANVYTKLKCVPTEEYVDTTVRLALDSYSREDLESMLVNYIAKETPVDKDSVEEYVSEMDDETIREYAKEGLEEKVRKEYSKNMQSQLESKTVEELAEALDTDSFTEDQWARVYEEYLTPKMEDNSYDENLSELGWADLDNPTSISLYVSSFADKDAIADCIARYNAGVPEEDQVVYSDYMALLTSSLTSMVNVVSYVLVAFVAISLVVSSIMIGIITHISVLERTREIGILRALGASKKDISRVFVAETFTEGLASGLLGVAIGVGSMVVINGVVQSVSAIAGLRAALTPIAAVMLIVVSTLMTVLAGLLPAGFAAKKDPVAALRSE